MNNIDPATNQPFALHTVTLPDAGNGNNAPVSAGASLVVVYRDPSKPLRKILIYDGIGVLPKHGGRDAATADPRNLSVEADSGARLTQIASASQPNGTDRLFFSSSRGTDTPRERSISRHVERFGPFLDWPARSTSVSFS